MYNFTPNNQIEKFSIKFLLTDAGKTRQESTLLALRKIRKMNCTKVLIHDAARPNPSEKLIRNIINELKRNNAVIPVLKV